MSGVWDLIQGSVTPGPVLLAPMLQLPYIVLPLKPATFSLVPLTTEYAPFPWCLLLFEPLEDSCPQDCESTKPRCPVSHLCSEDITCTYFIRLL